MACARDPRRCANVGRRIGDEQSYFVRGFANDLEDGWRDGDEAAVRRRLASYVGRMRGTACEGWVYGQADDAMFNWDTGGIGGDCPDCEAYASLSPYRKDELSAYPGDGSTQCIFNCQCRLVRLDGASGPDPISITPDTGDPNELSGGARVEFEDREAVESVLRETWGYFPSRTELVDAAGFDVGSEEDVTISVHDGGSVKVTLGIEARVVEAIQGAVSWRPVGEVGDGGASSDSDDSVAIPVRRDITPDEFIKRFKNAELEHIAVFDGDELVSKVMRGSKHNVALDDADVLLARGKTVIHNHPHGGFPSSADLLFATDVTPRKMIIVCRHWRFEMEIPDDGWPSFLMLDRLLDSVLDELGKTVEGRWKRSDSENATRMFAEELARSGVKSSYVRHR